MKNIEDLYPLSPMQEGMLFQSLFAPGSGVYIRQISFSMHQILDVENFRQIWQRVVDRHAILRTFFVWDNIKSPVQAVLRQVELPVHHLDWRGLAHAEQQQRLMAFLEEDKLLGFDMSRAPLMRLTLIRTAEDTHQIIWTFHHILLDGWSVSLFTSEVAAIYSALSRGVEPRLDPSIPYRSYIVWLQQQNFARAESFWRQTLKALAAPTPLVVDRPSQSAHEHASGIEQVLLSGPETAGLTAFAHRQGLTLNTLVQAAWVLLLSRYSGLDDVLYGSVTSGRTPELDGIETMMGLFVNTLATRVRVPHQAELLVWLKQLQLQLAEARQYEYTPLVDVQGWSEIPRGQQMFESIVVFENFPPHTFAEEKQDGNLRIGEFMNLGKSNLPLTLESRSAAEMPLSIRYDGSRFDAETITRMLDHLKMLLNGMAADPEQRISQLPLLTDAERQQLLADLNNTASDYPSTACLHHLFQSQAERHPHSTALIYEGDCLSYGHLNRLSNRLAHRLIDLGAAPDSVVAICCDRSLQMVISLLAVLKAGAAYLPLDPSYPQERLSFMLKDSGSLLLLSDAKYADQFADSGINIISPGGEWLEEGSGYEENPATAVCEENLAYLLYTSGSTGLPKGVQITHRAVVNFLLTMQEQPGLSERDRLLAVTSLSFDIAGLELYLPLISGACVMIAGREMVSEAPQLWDAISAHNITIMQATPATWHMLLEAGSRGDNQLKILCGGEALSQEIAQRLLETGTSVWNLYGPTETTIWSLAHQVQDTIGTIPIGRPIANTQIYLLDQHLQPAPVTVPAQLLIGGDGLARGYFNRPDLSADKFIPDPFSHSPGSRLYTTGDLARYLPDGNIEFLGRIDHQVKIRGFRIELGEIEAALSSFPGVKQALVVSRRDAAHHDRLVAYLVASIDDPGPGQLRDFLKQKLPDYMVPSWFVMLDRLPLTPNGKVDRKALPEPDSERPLIGQAFIAPRDEVESLLASIWEEVLNVRPVGVTDSFFDLGGHSFLAVRLMSQIHKQFSRDLPLSTLFKAHTIEQLADILRQHNEALPWSPLVEIQPGRSAQPFFCVHPIGGEVICYAALANYLGPDQPFYGLEAPRLDDVSGYFISIEALAAHYIEVVRGVKPHGPYLLGGWSFGGIVAFEMARQLTRQAEQVALLTLFDTWTPRSHSVLPDDAHLLYELIRNQARKRDLQLPFTLDDLRVFGEDEILGFALRQAQDLGVVPPEMNVDWLTKYLQGYRARRRALHEYVPQVYAGKITLYRVSDLDAEFFTILRQVGVDTNDPTMGWQELSSEPVEIHFVPGHHEVMMRDPNVEKLAQGLSASIHRATTSSSNWLTAEQVKPVFPGAPMPGSGLKRIEQ